MKVDIMLPEIELSLAFIPGNHLNMVATYSSYVKSAHLRGLTSKLSRGHDNAKRPQGRRPEWELGRKRYGLAGAWAESTTGYE
jgi:hypothetical protein